MMLRQDGYLSLAERMDAAVGLAIGAPTLVECELVLTGRLGERARADLLGFVHGNRLDVLAFDEVHWREAGGAFNRFGEGRHPAGLNFGDCLTYATARLAREPLLCLGTDFALTDLELVPLEGPVRRGFQGA